MHIDPTTFIGSLTLTMLAAILVGILGWMLRPLRIWLIERLLVSIALFHTAANRLIGNEVVRIFANRKSMDRHLLRDFKQTTRVFMITGRGIQIQAEPPFMYLLNQRNPAEHLVDVRIILPVSDAGDDRIDWTNVNEQSMRAIDPAYGMGTLAKQIEAAESVLRTYKDNGKIEDIRRSNIPHFARIIITDSGVYLNPYNEEKPSLHNKILKFRKGGEMARLWERFFRLLWNNPR